ncbi:MAG: GNAT family N-acetyltransferase [Phycicoccus sp.]
MTGDPGPGPVSAAELPYELVVGDVVRLVDRATAADVGPVVDLLRDDPLGSGREGGGAGHDLAPYHEAFAAVDDDPHQLLVVVRSVDGRVVATAQLTYLRTLSRRGALRLQVEAVRVSATERGSGLGQALFDWAVAHGRGRGAVIAQLTTDRRRPDAHRFYERLGWVHSHRGYKLDLS